MFGIVHDVRFAAPVLILKMLFKVCRTFGDTVVDRYGYGRATTHSIVF